MLGGITQVSEAWSGLCKAVSVNEVGSGPWSSDCNLFWSIIHASRSRFLSLYLWKIHSVLSKRQKPHSISLCFAVEQLIMMCFFFTSRISLLYLPFTPETVLKSQSLHYQPQTRETKRQNSSPNTHSYEQTESSQPRLGYTYSKSFPAMEPELISHYH